jgi:pimeloyl-ACP methyl ester carboxylesterase
MSRHKVLSAVVLLSVGALLLWLGLRWAYPRPDALTLPSGARMEWTSCWFGRFGWRPVYCGRFDTGPDPGTDPGLVGPSFRLPVLVLPAPRWRRAATPLLYIAGGPGGNAWLEPENVATWADWYEQLGGERDLVIYDQRGAGLSEPRLDCPEVRAVGQELLSQALDNETYFSRQFEAGRRCHDRLLGEGHDFRRFSTRLNARDADQLMQALGYASWDVYGVSYGSRVALEMMRLAPERLRAAVLDSVYPPDVNALVTLPWLLDRVLYYAVGTCERPDDCLVERARIAEALRAALADLRGEMREIQLPHPRDPSRLLSYIFNDLDIAWALFDAFYRWDLPDKMPEAIRALSQGEVTADMREILGGALQVLFDETYSLAVGTAVVCHDEVLPTEAEYERQRQARPAVSGLVGFEWRYNYCRFWDSGDAGAAFRQPVRSGVPTLLLNLEQDPVTPPHWAEAAATGLSRSMTVIFPGPGHGVVDSHECGIELVNAFLRDPKAPLKPDCLERF